MRCETVQIEFEFGCIILPCTVACKEVLRRYNCGLTMHAVYRLTILDCYEGGSLMSPVNCSGVEIEDEQGEGREEGSNCKARGEGQYVS